MVEGRDRATGPSHRPRRWRKDAQLKVIPGQLGHCRGDGHVGSIPMGATFTSSFSKSSGSKRKLQGWGNNEKGSLFSPQSELLAHQTLEMLTANGCSCFIAYLWESI